MRRHWFNVCMTVPDDDQTDPADMLEVLEDVLNCKGSAHADWRITHDEMVPESRPKFKVYESED